MYNSGSRRHITTISLNTPAEQFRMKKLHILHAIFISQYLLWQVLSQVLGWGGLVNSEYNKLISMNRYLQYLLREDIIKTHHKDIFSYRQGHEEADIWPETWLLRIGGYKQRRTGKSNLTEAAVNQCHARAQASKVWRAERRPAGTKHTVRGTEAGFPSCPATCRVAKSSLPCL